MPRIRPNMSITLPRNFTFHYTDGAEPKTPEPIDQQSLPQPPSPHPYRIRRRLRPSIVTSGLNGGSEPDVPIPTIEEPELFDSALSLKQQYCTAPADGYLVPLLSGRSYSVPRTPTPNASLLSSTWYTSDRMTMGDSIRRPLSACSITSDSSDDSTYSSENCPSLGGSCTSPESDSTEPFNFGSVRRFKLRSSAPLDVTPSNETPPRSASKTSWTPEMDRHLWKTYMIYIQDPTITPFKMLPGSPPPLGVCHRVGRSARRSWRTAKRPPSKSSDAPGDPPGAVDGSLNARAGSPDTITAGRSGSSTPTVAVTQKSHIWPKSSSATRRRLRELCRRKATIAPHYQRLIQSRSPDPFSSRSSSASRALRISSPVVAGPSPFASRDIQVSLTLSTSSTMQPNGPLAQLTKQEPQHPRHDEWFNDPTAPWASPAPIPAEDDVEMSNNQAATDLPRLGSPFGFHTWGPSRSRPALPSTAASTQSNVSLRVPHLRSPVQLHGTFPYPTAHNKRRAQHQLEDQLSPESSDIRKNLLEQLFGHTAAPDGNRRVRSRGFSLGDMTVHDRLTTLFKPTAEGVVPPTSDGGPGTVGDPPSDGLSHIESIRRLGSPFAGIGSRPSRARARHLPSASLPSYDPGYLPSIDQHLV